MESIVMVITKLKIINVRSLNDVHLWIPVGSLCAHFKDWKEY